ncbi:MAG: hypothetical protein JWQ42_237 [Edaphobacter sp.]|nr:hypothetical protein [Edaphobacter sp.]
MYKEKTTAGRYSYLSAAAASFKGWLPEERSPLSTGAHVPSSEKQSITHRVCSQGITSS